MKETDIFLKKFYIAKGNADGSAGHMKPFCNIVNISINPEPSYVDYNKINIDNLDINVDSNDRTRLKLLFITYCNNNYVEPSLMKAEHGWATPILVTSPLNSHGLNLAGKYKNINKFIRLFEHIIEDLNSKNTEDGGIEFSYPSYINDKEIVKLVISPSQRKLIIENLNFLISTLHAIKTEVDNDPHNKEKDISENYMELSIYNGWIAYPQICLKDCRILNGNDNKNVFTAFGISETFASDNITIKSNHVTSTVKGFTSFRANSLPTSYIPNTYCDDGTIVLNKDGTLTVNYNIDVFSNAFDNIEVDEERKNVLNPTQDREEYFGWSNIKFTFQPIDNLMRDKKTIEKVAAFINEVKSFNDYPNPDDRIKATLSGFNSIFYFNLGSIEIMQSKNRAKLTKATDYLKACIKNLGLDNYVFDVDKNSDDYAIVNFEYDRGAGTGDYALTIDECDPYTKYITLTEILPNE